MSKRSTKESGGDNDRHWRHLRARKECSVSLSPRGKTKNSG